MAKAKKVKQSGRPQRSTLTAAGHETPDPQPRAPSISAKRARSIRENVLDIVRSENFRRQMEDAGEETFEEADDFDVDDDIDPSAPYEEYFEGEFNYLREQRIAQAAENRRQMRRGRPKADKKVDGDPGQTGAPTPTPAVVERRDDHS